MAAAAAPQPLVGALTQPLPRNHLPTRNLGDGPSGTAEGRRREACRVRVYSCLGPHAQNGSEDLETSRETCSSKTGHTPRRPSSSGPFCPWPLGHTNNLGHWSALGQAAVRYVGMVCVVGFLHYLAPSTRLPACNYAAAFLGWNGGDLPDMDVAKAGFRKTRSVCGTPIRLLSRTQRGRSCLQDCDYSPPGRVNRLIHLLRRSDHLV